jgi:hypothetical protein
MAVAALVSAPVSVFGIGKRLAELLAQAEAESAGEHLSEAVRDQIADIIEILRSRVVRRSERDLRSLFDLDERMIDLMDRVEDATAEGGEVPEKLMQEITEYLEAFRTKVDRIAGYWRWQESIAEICPKEVERLDARRTAAAGRLDRLKSMLLAFMLRWDLKRLEGEKASIGMQRNSAPSLVIDDASQIGDTYFERTLRFTRSEFRDLVAQLPEGDFAAAWRHRSRATTGKSTAPQCDAPLLTICR